MSSQRPLAAVILAAGKGKRMKSDLPKVMHPVGGKPMVEHVIDQARAAGADPVVVVVGHGREHVESVVQSKGARSAVQAQQLGTGHAVLQAEPPLEGFEGDVIVLSGDVPLLRDETIREVVAYHREKGAVATVITAEAPDPTGYGRVIRDAEGRVVAIREHKDCSGEELAIREINSGIYVFDSRHLFDALSRVDNDNAQGEYYLPDVFAEFFERGLTVAAEAAGFDEIHGVNNPDQLRQADEIWRRRHDTA